jgi:hypothetical protein
MCSLLHIRIIGPYMDQTKEDEAGVARSAHDVSTNAYRTSVGTRDRKKPLGRCRSVGE